MYEQLIKESKKAQAEIDALIAEVKFGVLPAQDYERLAKPHKAVQQRVKRDCEFLHHCEYPSAMTGIGLQ